MKTTALAAALLASCVLAQAPLLRAQTAPVSRAPARATVDTLTEDGRPLKDSDVTTGPIDRVIDFLTIEPNEKRVARDPERYYPSKIVFSPYVIFTPETSFGFGVGGSYLFKMPGSGDEERTRTSAIPIAFTYTLENQVLFYSGFEVFWPDEEWVLSGNFRGSIFPRLFYGIGPRTPDYGELEAFNENDIVFQSREIVLEPIISKQAFIDRLFLGAGVRYRKVGATSFEFLEEGLVPEGGPALLDGFRAIDGAGGSTSVGVEAAALYDTRNSLLNAQRGTYIEATYGVYGEVLGGTHAYDLVRVDARRFWQLNGRENHRDVFGVQGIGYFATGNVPLVELAQLGSVEIMRGYYEGRYTDRHYAAAQAEYRLNLKDSPVGFVGFASAGAIAPEVSSLVDSPLRTAVGAGIRFEVDPVERLNLRADVAFTGEGGFNVYLQIGEAF